MSGAGPMRSSAGLLQRITQCSVFSMGVKDQIAELWPTITA